MCVDPNAAISHFASQDGLYSPIHLMFPFETHTSDQRGWFGSEKWLYDYMAISKFQAFVYTPDPLMLSKVEREAFRSMKSASCLLYKISLASCVSVPSALSPETTFHLFPFARRHQSYPIFNES